ncbi:hypothetical protein KEM52_005363 [Ascosphaera acerosa]|nr:hypothetical protein KEM52_005363 [Ascosphaera acerosa]
MEHSRSRSRSRTASMSRPGIWVTTKLSMGTTANRDKLMDGTRIVVVAGQVFGMYSDCARHAWLREPGVLRYFIALPRAFEDDTTLYIFKEYADQETLEAHFAQLPASTVMAFLQSDPTILTPIMDVCTTSASFTRGAELPDDPTIVYASITYASSETREEALRGWQDVAQATRDTEPGTLSYHVLRDQDDRTNVKILEIHESEEWLFEVHAKSQAVVRNREQYGSTRTHVEHVRLRKAGGFLLRP